MMIRYFLIFLLCAEIFYAASTRQSEEDATELKTSCNITSLHAKKSRLLQRKEYVEDRIQELWDKTNNQEADTSEAAKLKAFLNELKSIDRKLIRTERLLQKQLCRFL